MSSSCACVIHSCTVKSPRSSVFPYFAWPRSDLSENFWMTASTMESPDDISFLSIPITLNLFMVGINISMTLYPKRRFGRMNTRVNRFVCVFILPKSIHPKRRFWNAEQTTLQGWVYKPQQARCIDDRLMLLSFVSSGKLGTKDHSIP